MHVLLISANTERMNIPTLPLGLAQVAAATEQAGHSVSLLNLMLAGDPDEAVRDAIQAATPGVIGISVRNIDDQNMENPKFLLEPVRKVVEVCRGFSPAPVVLGGAGYSIFPHAALEFLGADFGVAGEGEETFPALVSRIERSQNRASLPGVHVAGRQTEIVTSHSAADLDRFPVPDPATWLRSAPADFIVPVQSRRGCPLDCSYCSTALVEGRTVRRRSPRLVVHELGRARAAGFRHFYFVDNTFNLPEACALELCREIARAGVDIEWRAIVYPSGLSPDLARAMREAGCVEASIGFESGDERILRAMNKQFGVEDVRATSRQLADHGMRRHGFLLLGGPGETRRSIDTSLAFADSLRLDSLKVTLGIRIYPDTRLHRIAVAEGVVSPTDDLLRPRFYLARGCEKVAGSG